MNPPPIRYQSPDEDSGRWHDFPFRPGDMVISTRSKSGTTWLQMICALLVLRTPELPAPLADLSPWLDWLGNPRDEVYARLAAQPHRRFIKTHTPLDGIPIDPRVTYLVTARHPLDQAVSLYHHSNNLDRERLRQVTGQPAPRQPAALRLPLADWLQSWIDWDGDPQSQLDTLPGVMRHLNDAWSRRSAPNVLLLHYDDLLSDLAGQMRQLAAAVEISVPESEWPALIDAATFPRMRARAAQLAPNAQGVIKDPTVFFRQGRSGAGRTLLDESALARYHARVARLAPPDLLRWLHRDPPSG